MCKFCGCLSTKRVCTLGVLLQQCSGSTPLYLSCSDILIWIFICRQQRRAETFWTPHPPRAARPRLCRCLFSCGDVMGLDGWKQYSQERPGDPDTLSSRMCSQEWWRRQEVGPPCLNSALVGIGISRGGVRPGCSRAFASVCTQDTVDGNTQSGSKTFKSLTCWCVMAKWPVPVVFAKWKKCLSFLGVNVFVKCKKCFIFVMTKLKLLNH